MEMTKRQKVESMSRQSLFRDLPDEMVLNILSYGKMEDIQNTRVWQSKKVQRCTETISNIKASCNNNLDNLKWIYGFIGDTDFTGNLSEDGIELNCTGNDKTSIQWCKF